MRGDKIKLLTNNKEIILNNYLSGQTIKYLGQVFGVSEVFMRKFLISNGIQTRSNPFERKFNERFFKIPSIELAYFMGFCLADGSITKKEDHRSTLEICVHTEDKEVLQKFCQWTNYNVDYISKRKNSELLRLCFNSKLFKEDFSQWGLVNNKTYFPHIPKIATKYIKPFLLGYIDGDGSIGINPRHNHFNIVGNRQLIDWFCQTIYNLGFTEPFKFEDIEGKVWKRAIIYKKENIIKLSMILGIQNYKHIILLRKWHNLL